MLLQKIKLENFRQFVSEEIDFSTDPIKNVTIIDGDNGTGKTTFAQAFFWCLYGETSFSDKNVLNRQVARDLLPSKTATVMVALSLTHGSARYQIVRTQEYKKNNSNAVVANNSVLDIAITTSDGNTKWLSHNECEIEIKKILPKELSGYFFFDGERIEKLSKEIMSGHRSKGFKEAVAGLTGLQGIASALTHLAPTKSGSVIGKFNGDLEGESKDDIQQLTDEINKAEKEIDEIDKRLIEIEDEIDAAREKKASAEEELKQYKEGEKIQAEKEELEKALNSSKTYKSQIVKNVVTNFNSDLRAFLGLSLAKEALEMVSDSDFGGKDIPKLEGETVNYLLNRGKCICETHLDPGSYAYNKVKELLDYVPPKAISSVIGDYKKDFRVLYGSDIKLFENVEENFRIISEQDDLITDIEEKLMAVSALLDGDELKKKVGNIGVRITTSESAIKEGEKERDNKIERKGELKHKIQGLDVKRNDLSLQDKNNKIILINREYARAIHEQLKAEYNLKETQVRERLQTLINEHFKYIYNGGLGLSIDDNYNISVNVLKYDEDNVETSTAQSISVIFAFISAIIKMARENQNEEGYYSEPYPLVMDAPLSAFDKHRIKAICESIPETAEQVVIFIKDTDGDIAREYLGDKIGKAHSFEKIDEFHTKLM